MDKETPLVTPAEAKELLDKLGVNVTVTTVLNWCRERGWGMQLPGGRWMVHRVKVEELAKEIKDAATETARSSSKL